MIVTSLQPNLKPCCFKPLTSFSSQNPNFFLLKSLTFSPRTSIFAKPIISLQVKVKPSVFSDELPLDDSPSESSSDKEVSFFLFFFSEKMGLNGLIFCYQIKPAKV